MLETIRSAAPISRAEISRQAGISKPTVSLALQSLLEVGPRPRGRSRTPGRPRYGAVFFEAVPEAALVLGRRHRRTVPARRDLRSVRRRACPPGRRADGRRGGKALDTIAKLRTSLVDASGLPARPIDARSSASRRSSTTRPGLSSRRTCPASRAATSAPTCVERLDLPVTLENDINLAARRRAVARRRARHGGLRLHLGRHRTGRRARAARRAPPRA